MSEDNKTTEQNVAESSSSVPSTGHKKNSAKNDETGSINQDQRASSQSVNDVIDKISGHVKEVTREAAREAMQEQLAEMDRRESEEAGALIRNFNANFDQFSKENPEIAEKIVKLTGDPNSELSRMGNGDFSFLFSNAPQILAEFAKNPNEIKQYNALSPDKKIESFHLNIDRKAS